MCNSYCSMVYTVQYSPVTSRRAAEVVFPFLLLAARATIPANRLRGDGIVRVCRTPDPVGEGSSDISYWSRPRWYSLPVTGQSFKLHCTCIDSKDIKTFIQEHIAFRANCRISAHYVSKDISHLLISASNAIICKEFVNQINSELGNIIDR